jgi:3,4-dihydroxy 2-butanone 4-phosphate synthase/GTP cyclohydrolase II
MSEENGGIIIYLNQEGRGIGLTNKVRVYHAQSMGFDTVEANENLGLQGDSRGFAIAAKILKSLDIHQINLLSNNPTKAQDLIKEGIEVKDVFSHQFLNDEVKKYYQTKAQKFKHKIDV